MPPMFLATSAGGDGLQAILSERTQRSGSSSTRADSDTGSDDFALRGPGSWSGTPTKGVCEDGMEAATVIELGPRSSVGSVLHNSGTCRPCAWFWKPGGCTNGVQCRHCHACPPGELQRRKKDKRKSAKEAAHIGAFEFDSLAEGDRPLPCPDDGNINLGGALDVESFRAALAIFDCYCAGCSTDGALAPPAPQPEAPLPPWLAATWGASVLASWTEAIRLEADAAPALAPSIGSAAHASGSCKPCAWFWKRQGCRNSDQCRHCHLCLEGEIASRKKAKHRMMSEQKTLGLPVYL
eukprot:CAMPEP_0176080110 /NCGR_PEP_ID=MMETSP0120_2-20121206/40069_1 /TAXON_ID=160619 /ORGANISM="Kryptoperidinium foliaceum, Strain CCMP 1326" /LENGTH=294 /DNA_ID=CAMNT_0017413871 /DNA_START=107 /DNA_END=991 /DNA_ORIENTATION=+